VALFGVVGWPHPAWPGEYAVLTSGFRIYAERHERERDVVRLYQGTSTLEIPASLVTAFEPGEPAPAPPDFPAPPQAKADPKELIRRAAARHGLPEEFLLSVAAAESGFRQDAVSPKGAVGLMQLMPGTAKELQADPQDPEQNVDAGARYLRWLLLKYLNDPYQVRKALAAYNAGPGAVERYGGIPPYRETLRFIERVLSQRRPAATP
jgi:soluble lytic murein transglycosylase-like protein